MCEICRELSTSSQLLASLWELVGEWNTARAHTYASENADEYRAFDAAQKDCAASLAEVLREYAKQNQV